MLKILHITDIDIHQGKEEELNEEEGQLMIEGSDAEAAENCETRESFDISVISAMGSKGGAGL